MRRPSSHLDFLELLCAICFGLLCAGIAYLIWKTLL